MRFMIIVKATRDSEARQIREETVTAEMPKYHEELQKAGKRSVIDGPFAEAKEISAGDTLIQGAP